MAVFGNSGIVVAIVRQKNSGAIHQYRGAICTHAHNNRLETPPTSSHALVVLCQPSVSIHHVSRVHHAWYMYNVHGMVLICKSREC